MPNKILLNISELTSSLTFHFAFSMPGMAESKAPTSEPARIATKGCIKLFSVRWIASVAAITPEK
ncbi:hypothetical protein D3C78_1870620 [compost metagenome]